MKRKYTEMKLTVSECKEKIADADMVLIGLGKELEPDFEAVLKSNDIYNRFKDDIDSMEQTEGVWLEYAIYYHELVSMNNPIINKKLELINKLAQAVATKNIFVVSTCDLDVVRYSDFDKERIVTPCGTILKKECHVGCKRDVYSAVEDYEKIYKKLTSMYKADEFDVMSIMNVIPICEKCEATMEPNLLKMVSYSEEGYLKKWELYNKWLSGTVNRKLVMLELGENFNTPTVIRWPFEKIALINKKSLLIRVNKKFPMLVPEISETAVALDMTSEEFIQEISK